MNNLPSINDSDIAVIGMSCRFPGARTIKEFWQNLKNGVESISVFSDEELLAEGIKPAILERPDYVKAEAVLSDIDLFDARFFGFTPREAQTTDPQHRIFLECAWEALEDAGYTAGTDDYSIGVYAGAGMTSYLFAHLPHELPFLEAEAFSTLLGNDKDYLATHVSYKLDLKGPAVSVQTACSTSLVATHMACQSLLSGECDIALAGGVSARVPHKSGYFHHEAMMLSPDGHCRAFDADSQGTVPGNGAGIVVLKRLADALADGDAVYAVIKGSAVNNDGSGKVGFTAPSVEGQAAVISEAQALADVDPESISYVEAHGTGTKLGDPIEIAALTQAFRKGTDRKGFCAIGSVKTNFGHLDAAAGVAALIKTVLALKHRRIPPSLHFNSPNPDIDFAGSPFYVNANLADWKSGEGPRRAGVSSFGIGGTNAHMVLEEAPVVEDESTVNETERPLHPLTLSAKTAKALGELAGKYAAHLEAHPEIPFPDVCFTAATRRSLFDHRLALVADSSRDAREQLLTKNYLVGEVSHKNPRIAFLFTGQGSEYPDMGRRLFETEPLFRETIERCNTILRGHNVPLLDLLYPDGSNPDIELSTDMTWLQPVLFSLEYALAKLWQSWGVVPDVVMGHSIGEYVAACVAGVFSLEDGLKLVANRGRLMQACPEGRMLAVWVSEEKAMEIIAPFGEAVSVAVINAPDSVVLSGEPEAIESIRVGFAENKDIKTKLQLLPIPRASHSPLMKPVLAEFGKVAGSVTYARPEIPLCSNVTGAVVTDEITSPEYWVRHMRQPVRFAASVQTLHEQGITAFLEIGPTPALLAIVGQCLPDDAKSLFLPTLRAGQEDWRQMLDSLGQWHVHGGRMDWMAFDKDDARRKVELPTYPFQRQRYWLDKAPPARQAVRDLSAHPLLGRRFQLAGRDEIGFESEIGTLSIPWLVSHRIFDAAVLPATGYLEMALAASADVAGAKHAGPVPVQIQNIAFEHALILPEEKTTTIQLVLSPETQGLPPADASLPTGKEQHYRFQVFSRGTASQWTSHVTGQLIVDSTEEQPDATERVDLAELLSQCPTKLSVADQYQAWRERGLNYGADFQGIEQFFRGDGMAMGKIDLPESLFAEANTKEVDQYQLHPALFDACLQVILVVVFDPSDTSNETWVPTAMEKVHVYRTATRPLWSVAKVVDSGEMDSDKQGLALGISIFDESGIPIARIEGLAAKRIDGEMIRRYFKKENDDLYEIDWMPVPLPEGATIDSTKLSDTDETVGSWLVFADGGGVGEELARDLEGQGDICILAYASTGGIVRATGRSPLSVDNIHHLNPAEPADFQRLLKDAFQKETPPLKGIIHLWSLDAPDSADLTADTLTETQTLTCGSVMHLVQGAIGEGQSARLWIVTCGAIGVARAPGPLAVSQAPLWGLGKTITQEHPEFRCALVDLDPKAQRDFQTRALIEEIVSDTREDQIAFRDGERYVARLVRYGRGQERGKLDIPREGPYRLKISERGILENLKLAPVTRCSPKAGEVEIRVWASGLNFLDVINALGMFSGNDDLPIGGECAGEIVAIGEGVEDFRVGDPVIAIAIDAFGQYVTTDARLAVPKPESLNFQETATIPVVFLTAYFALYRLAGILPGDKVLIHAAADDVGLAAVQLARLAGAEVFATASPPKWAFLESLGIEHVMNSLTTDFAEEIMAATKGQGVDVVLNSLTSEGFIEKSLSALTTDGRFLEISKANIWQPSEVASVRADVAYSILDLARMPEWKGIAVQPEPDSVGLALRELMRLFRAGELKPLSYRAFPITDAVNAFRYMQQAKHIGKIILTLPLDIAPIRSDSTYLITGGLGGLGLEVAKWMVDKGARNLLLVSRRGPSDEARAVIERLEERGAGVWVISADISDEARMVRLFREMNANMPPLRGIIHAAGFLADGVLLQQDMARFEKVMAPKVAGSWILHTLTQNLPLDFFVCFSSTSSLLGNAGQGNYASANAFMDALACHRRNSRLPGLSVNWGAWAEIGLAARMDRHQDRLAAMGMGAIDQERGISILAELMGQTESVQVGVFPIHWPRFLKRFPMVPAFLSKLAQGLLPPTESVAIGHRLAQAPEEEHEGILIEFIRGKLANTIRIEPAQLDVHQPLNTVGLDSLMVVELRNKIRSELGIDIPMARFMGEAGVIDLTREIAIQLEAQRMDADAAPSTLPTGAAMSGSKEQMLARLESGQMSEEEMNKLIKEYSQHE